jgi:hypothetical protein
MVFKELVEYTFQFLMEAIFHIISFILCWGMNIQNNNMKLVTSQYYVWLPITNKLNPLNHWYDSLMYKKTLYPIHGSHSPFHRKMCILLVQCHCPPIWPPTLPLNLTHIWIVPSKLPLGIPPYTNYLCCMCLISCPYSFA